MNYILSKFILIKAILKSFMVVINLFKGVYNMFFKLRFFFFQNLYKIFSMKIILLSTAITIVYSYFLLGLEINLNEFIVDFTSEGRYYYFLYDNLGGVHLIVNNLASLASTSKFYLLFFNGIAFFFILLHFFFAFISLIYDYLLKRLYIFNVYILVFFILVSLQILLKIFFIIILCFL